MSREALQRFAKGLNMSKFMSRPESYAPAEDVLVGTREVMTNKQSKGFILVYRRTSIIAQQLQKNNVIFGDSRDDLGRSRFFPLMINYFLVPKKLAKVKWFQQWTYYSMKGVIVAVTTIYSQTVQISPNMLKFRIPCTG